jgi:hypothetical protein
VIVAGASGNGANTVAPVLWNTAGASGSADASGSAGASGTAGNPEGTMEVRLLPSTTAKKTFAAESSGYATLEASEKEFLGAESTRLLYVACTRAETHLVVSLHRYKDTKFPAFAAQLAEAPLALKDAYVFSAKDATEIVPREPEPVLAPVAELPHEEWLSLRERWMANSAILASHPITSLAKDPENAPVENPFVGAGAFVFIPDPFVADAPPKRAAGAGPRFVDLGAPEEPAAEESAAEDSAPAGSATDEPAADFDSDAGFDGDATGPDSSADAGHVVGASARQGLGARLGTAVHKTIELSNLVADELLDGFAQVAAAMRESEVADWRLVAERARAALATEPLQRAATREHWLELPMTRAVGVTVLEGVADLVYREDDGSLVIVDFKTDQSLDEAKLQGYWAQLSAYANMIHQATGDSVSQLVLVQCSKSPARVISAMRTAPTAIHTVSQLETGVSPLGSAALGSGALNEMAATHTGLAPEWRAAIALTNSVDESQLLISLAEAGDIELPEIGFETSDGIPVPIAWPQHKIVANVNLSSLDRDDLTAAGWKLVEPSAITIRSALAQAGNN